MRDINELISYVTGLRNEGNSTFRECMAELGDPQDKFRSIHVAGTNGKGSTTNFMKDILRCAGYTVGTFTSPHLIAHQDRIRVNDVWIEDEAFVRIYEENEELIKKHKLNMFEIDMLIASLYFIEKKVDVAIIEVGLGGRLDSTNVLHHPLLSIVTTIGYDHMDRLGNTLEEIAAEKAGIFKEGVPCLVGKMTEGCVEVMKQKALGELTVLGAYTKVDRHHFIYKGEEYEVATPVEYQFHNASLAIEAMHILKDEFDVADHIHEGIRISKWAGRFEQVMNSPCVILDGAHNDEGIRALCAGLDEVERPLRIVFSALKDKPAKAMGKMLEGYADHMIVTQFDFYRVAKAVDIATDQEVIEDYEKAIEKAIAMDEKGTVLICGSLYFISEARQYMLKRRGV